MKRDVYCTNVFGHDVSNAENFVEDGGEVINITEGRINIFKTDSLERKIMGALKDMKSTDLILIAGNSFVASLVCAYVIKRFGILNVLIWDHNERSYTLRTVDFKQIKIRLK